MTDERRKFARLDTRLLVSYQVAGSARSIRVVTRNVSGGGVCMFLEERLPIGTRLQVRITLPDYEATATLSAKAITFAGEVVWCEAFEISQDERRGSAAPHHAVMAGIKIVDVAPETQQEIMRYVILNLQLPPAP